MSHLFLELDHAASKSLYDLMNHYNVKSKAELITKAIAALKIAALVDQTNGELIARKGHCESRIRIR